MYVAADSELPQDLIIREQRKHSQLVLIAVVLLVIKFFFVCG
jgi:hypothetical protein